MKCPNCGTKIKFWLDTRFRNMGGVPCPKCPAVLKTTGAFKAAMSLGLIGLVLTVASAAILVLMLLPYSSETQPTGYETPALFLVLDVSLMILIAISMVRVKRIEVVRLRPTCQHCKTFMVVEDAEFCPNCGASMETPAWESITIDEEQLQTVKRTRRVRERKPIGACLVCNLELSSDDNVARCPHCQNVFHKTHLTKWVGKWKRCPACGEHLNRSEIKNGISRSNASKIGDV
jgi:RNA polymerase subunit RPABC4/transcription elongation factor Spt4